MTDHARPENKDAETLGNALFDEDGSGWASTYQINTFSIFFMTTAFLGLLEKGAKDRPDGTSAVINITSMSAMIKQAQDHVRKLNLEVVLINTKSFASSAITARKRQLRISLD